MPHLKSRYVPLAVFAVCVFAAGCGEVNSTIDKAQACLEAPKIIAELGTKLTDFANDPQAMEKALDETATKLNTVADDAANTTLKEASDNLAATLSGISVDNVNDTVDAAQKATAEGAAYLEQVAQACS
ncbi:hypothetical protein [Nonomuraea jiangxiensis]|uniref:Lipoprotein n=1 Tax=Nonomuraea jiangxiensis TaxID=633440 RepID=A0A1G8CJH0_9ACTN|nr:hypothetical protein [Nonomuraea jiangxiensis]SDH45608.1 hypothetical protein SAMN05421869_102315 [Nonomuraea jiangxiensis]